MKRLPIDYVILGNKYASALSDYLTSDSSGSVIFYLGEKVDYQYFVSQVQQLAKNLYTAMTFIFDTTMAEDKANLTQYFVYLKATFPKSRIIAVAPGLKNRELISNIYSCGVYDLLTLDVSGYADAQKVSVVCQAVDAAIDHPRAFADVYKDILWQVPVLEPKKEEPKGLIAKAKARREARLARKEAEKQAKEKAKRAKPEPVIDPYEAFLNASNTPVKTPEMPSQTSVQKGIAKPSEDHLLDVVDDTLEEIQWLDEDVIYFDKEPVQEETQDEGTDDTIDEITEVTEETDGQNIADRLPAELPEKVNKPKKSKVVNSLDDLFG